MRVHSAVASITAILGVLSQPVQGFPQDALERAVAPGQQIRIKAPARVEVLGVVAVEPDGTVRARQPYTEASGVITVRDEVRALDVPRPKTEISGRLLGADERTITISRDGRDLVIPREAVARIEIRTREGHPGVGAALGFAAGFAGGYAIAASSSTCDWNCAAWVLLAFPGLALGAWAWRDRYESLPVERVRVGILPRRGGAAAYVSMSF